MIEKLKELCDSNPERADDCIWDKEVFGKVSSHHYSGGEGKGEDYRTAYHLEDHGIWIEVAGTYYSHNGVEYYGSWEDCVYQVYPAVSLENVYTVSPQSKESLLEIQKKVSELLAQMD